MDIHYRENYPKQHSHENKIVPCPISVVSVNSQHLKEKTNTNSEESIQELLLCIEKLDKKVERFSGKFNVTKRINTLLRQEVDDLQQYQRRPCIIIDGINHGKDENITDITSKARPVMNKHFQISKAAL